MSPRERYPFWKGIFAHHAWIVVKERNAARYTRYDKVGWGRPVRTDGWPPDGRWFSPWRPDQDLSTDTGSRA